MALEAIVADEGLITTDELDGALSGMDDSARPDGSVIAG